jgi:hypothetical protein
LKRSDVLRGVAAGSRDGLYWFSLDVKMKAGCVSEKTCPIVLTVHEMCWDVIN